MATTGFQPTGSLSAALTIVHWVQKHGRPPTTMECKPSNGLMSFMTYYRRLPGSSFSAIVSAAFDLVSTAYTGVSTASAIRMRTCLGHGCEQRFPYQGAHIGFCATCRRRRSGAEEEWYEASMVPPSQVRRMGVAEDMISELMAL